MTDIALCESEQHHFELVESIEGDEKHYYIRGKFATIATRNINNRVYPRNLWEREVAKYQTQISEGTVNTLMEWEHPKGRLTVDPKNAVAKITKLWIEGDYVMGEAVIFDNPQAQTIKEMIKHGVKISVSSRASGSVGAGGIVERFDLITFDIVTNPSDQSATMPGVFESEEETTGTTEENKMTDQVVMENLVGILRSKNSEIRDLNEEIQILRGEISMNEAQDERIAKLMEEIADLRALIGSTDAPYGDDNQRGFKPYDDASNRYGEEAQEYTMRREIAGNDVGNMRHQDVSATLVDNDPSGYYASGEKEPSLPAKLIKDGGRADVVGSELGADVGDANEQNGVSSSVRKYPKPAQTGREAERGAQTPIIDAPIDGDKVIPTMNESKETKSINRFLATPNHLI